MKKEEELLHEKFVTYGANAKSWTRKCVLLLPEINRRIIWRKKGFGSIYEYAAKLAGMGKNAVDDAFRILEKIEDKPALRAVAEAKGLSAIRPVMAIATSGTEYFWARKAAAMSKHALETYVREFKKQGLILETADGGQSRPGTEFQIKKEEEKLVNTEAVEITMDLDKDTAEMLQKLKGDGDWNALMKELLSAQDTKLKAEEPEPVQAPSRYIPARIRNHALKKTNGGCAFPGCLKPAEIFHHTQRFALRPMHDVKTLAPLCKNHEQLAHHGLIHHEQEDPKHWRLRNEPDHEQAAYSIDRAVMSFMKG